jgi:hypothetical protein
VSDAAEILRRLCFENFAGTLNLVSGASISFRDILAEIEKLLGKSLDVVQRERSKAKVDQAYDNDRLRALLPDIRFAAMSVALKKMLDTIRN